MITIACVETGNYCGDGFGYVDRLLGMAKRNLESFDRFVVLTDDPKRHLGLECQQVPANLKGWWSKIALFEPGRFEGRVVYFDLDTVITGPLDELVATKGTIDLTHWGWPTHTLCSSVMVWDAGEHEEIWEEFNGDVPNRFRGDQDWITHLGGWPILPAHLCRSYRYHCVDGPPAGCRVVNFHGTPKPSQIVGGWVPKAWTR